MTSALDVDIEDLDFLELRVYDIHGYAKGRLVSKSAIPDVTKKGLSNFTLDPFEHAASKHYTMSPIMSTLKPCLKAVQGQRNVATVLCELRLPDGSLETAMPRETAFALLSQLKDEFGVSIKSTFELEFGIRDSSTGKPFGHEARYASTTVVQLAGDVLYDLLASMLEIGINIDTLLPEYGVGQFEITCDITEGIGAPDMIADFKTASYIFLKKRGLNVEFMTCVETRTPCYSGSHFNFSLWDSGGRNLFVNPDNSRELSAFGQHWLAGMIEHCPAMVALTSPTINCYRRVGYLPAPSYANWSEHDKTVSFRVKIEECQGNVYLENRVPSSACNPHLVLAATLVAGMDGVHRKLDLPPPGDKTKRLPVSLEEALEALDKDTVMKSGLGEGVVQMFIYTKRTFEVDGFKAFEVLSDEEKLLKEKELYYLPL